MDDKTRALLGDREAAKRLTDAGVVLMQGDCLELLQDIPDGSVDMVLTDPPYSSGGMYRSDRANGSSKKYQSTDTKDIKPDFAGIIETNAVLRFGKHFGFLLRKKDAPRRHRSHLYRLEAVGSDY